MKSDWEITPECKTLPVLHNPLLIEGLPGIGNVGKIAADYLVEELNAKLLYSFFSYKFPHSVFVNEKNLIEMPKLELYYKKFNSKTKRDLLILVGDIQPIDEESCFSFCDEIIKIAKHFKCTGIITTGGIGLQQIPEKPRVYCTANNSKILKEYQQKNMLVEKDIFGIVGPIVGVSGILLGLGRKRKMNGVAILAETFGHPLYLGIKGAKEVIRVIDTKLKYNIDLKKMSREISEVEKEIAKKTHDWLAEINQTQAAGAQSKKKEASYIG
ncbi:PAC2 family protein [Candidatus Woesearchaeota archaeon]|nr:PAC2 family protein [Candidatus Woesearchaeota archaeon]